MNTRSQDSTPVRSAPGRTRRRPSKRPELVEIGFRLLDEAHVAWQRAELECERALRAWHDGPPRASVDLYLSYRAALDHEQAAAHDLERMWELATSGHDALAAAAVAANTQRDFPS
ncbi:MAG TPA: hypothetical protein VMJ65_04965 [Solirubrobacteraceae bacterium]|nr:hypothetical protein [Solirubrobacteraceae bacterium]